MVKVSELQKILKKKTLVFEVYVGYSGARARMYGLAV
jgi:hypothetical protein